MRVTQIVLDNNHMAYASADSETVICWVPAHVELEVLRVIRGTAYDCYLIVHPRTKASVWVRCEN